MANKDRIDAWPHIGSGTGVVNRRGAQGPEKCGVRRQTAGLSSIIHTAMSPDTIRDPVIRSVTLRVHDAARSREFYEGILGLEGEGTSFAAPGGSEPLIHLVEAPDARPKPPRALGLYHFALLVPDRRALGAVLRRLADRGVRLQGASDHAVSEALYLADPDGHGIEIYRDRSEEEWSLTPEGELYMTTEALDLGSVAEEADAPGGLATGTVIGHIHLHVSSTQKAEAFYVGDLGFDVMVRSYPGALFVAAGGYHHHVGLNTWAGPRAERPDDGTIGMVSFSMRPPKEPVETEAMIADPDGIRIQLAGRSQAADELDG